MAWYDGQVTGPSNGQVIADTGAMSAGNITAAAIVHASLPCTFELQQVASDGTTVVKRQKISVVTGNESVNVAPIYITLDTDERLRIVTAQALTLGAVGASLFAF